MRSLRYLIFTLPLLCLAAHAQETRPVLDEARRLLDSGKATQAATLLDGDMLRWAGNVDFDMLLGLAQMQSNQSGQALFSFERVLMVDPTHVDARLKIARIYLDRGDAALAREILLPMDRGRLAGTQQQELDRVQVGITSVARDEPVYIRGYVAAGVGRDSNVTSGPGLTELIIPALGRLPTQLGTASRAADGVSTVEAGVSLRSTLDEDTWLTAGVSARDNFNRSRKDVSDGDINLDLGLLKRYGSNFFGATLLAQDYLVAKLIYRDTLGARFNFIHPFEGGSRLGFYAQQLRFGYQNTIDNATRKVIGATHEGGGGGFVWQYGLYGGKELAKDPTKPHFSYQIKGAHLGGSVPLGDRIALSAGVMSESHAHLETDALFRVLRRDSQRSLGVAVDFRLADKWHLTPRYTATRNASNLALYDTTRAALSLNLRWDFDNATK